MVEGGSFMKQERQIPVTKQRSFSILQGVGALIFVTSVAVPGTAQVEVEAAKAVPYAPPTVFQAAGPTTESIQSTIDAYRAALGAVNNGNAPGPLDSGRREINWDGGGATTTAPGPTPFTVFLNSRGANITTPGTGFVQAPLDGLVTTFANPTYATIFQTFSAFRLFTPVGSNKTEVEFFQPGSGTDIPATTTGFGAVFSDVDRPDGNGPGGKGAARKGSTLIEYFGWDHKLLFSSFVPASPGNASLSFFGVVFVDARIARVRITTGDKAPGRDDIARRDIVVMDDFFYGEPQAIH
jgi:hypothetical protein